jgi:hypothetical protein
MSKTDLSSVKIAEELFGNETYRDKLIEDFEIKFTTAGYLLYNPEVLCLFINFLTESSREHGIEWNESATQEEKFIFSKEIVDNFMNMVALKYSYLARFSLN